MKKHSVILTTIAGLAITVTGVAAMATKPFPDVPQNHWAYQAIEEGRTSGLWEGYPDGTFGLGKDIKREEVAVLFYRNNKMLLDKIAALENKVNER